jgi:queuine tRNA-ribosyltransferase
MSRLQFKLEAEATGSRARAATFLTLHSEVKTPLFMPVATRAAVRNHDFDILEDSGSQVLLANTYHLLLRPGPEVFRRLGGIHKLMNWKKSVLTDSGGFQIFSLPHSRKMTEEGAEFLSYVDQRKILLTPELSIETQKAIGSDIMMVLDQCVPSTSDRAIATEAMNLTHRWAKRSFEARGDSPQSLFAIIQGACFEDLRKQSAEFLTQIPFDGFAIGGLAVGETKTQREDFTELTAQLLPRHLPRYLMGVGTPIDLLEAVHRGVDMMDCILPVSLAQQGVAYTSRGRLELRRGVYRFSEDPLDPSCHCGTCAKFSKAYLHHLIKCREYLGWQLVGTHNLYFYHQLMKEIRESILNDTFAAYYHRKRAELVMRDEENPIQKPKKSRAPRRPPLTLGKYSVQTSSQGFSSIRDDRSGEIMHSVSDPELEAKRLYVDQPKLVARITDETLQDELVIWDVGLGAATNAMAVIRCCEEVAQAMAPKSIRAVRLVSFENDLDSLRLALSHPTLFKHLRHGAPHALLENSIWESKICPLRWELRVGDFLEHLKDAPVPAMILFDPFSYKTDSSLWTLETFQAIAKACEGRATELFTYSASTAARAALLAAGFFVAQGEGTGPKAETTIALTREALRSSNYSLLKTDWLGRWDRSSARVPELDQLIREHHQFKQPFSHETAPFLNNV